MRRTEIGIQEALKAFPISIYSKKLPDFTEQILYVLSLTGFHMGEITPRGLLCSVFTYRLNTKGKENEIRVA